MKELEKFLNKELNDTELLQLINYRDHRKNRLTELNELENTKHIGVTLWSDKRSTSFDLDQSFIRNAIRMEISTIKKEIKMVESILESHKNRTRES